MVDTVVESGALCDEAVLIFTKLCEGKLEGELTAGPANEPKVRTSVRFIRIDDGRLEVGLSTVKGESVDLAVGDAVVLRFVWCGQLYQIPARLRRRLASTTAGPFLSETLHFEKFGELDKIQRRETYRLSLLDLPPPLISFSPPDDWSVQTTGSLIELSESGGRALVASGVMQDLRPDNTYHVSFELPGDPDPYAFRAKITRIISSEDDILVVIGLAWQLDRSWSEERRLQARVAKFIAENQRKARG